MVRSQEQSLLWLTVTEEQARHGYRYKLHWNASLFQPVVSCPWYYNAPLCYSLSFSVKDINRRKRHNKSRQTKTKRARKAKHYSDLRKHEAQARKEQAKRDGTYQTGVNMQEGVVDGYSELDILLASAASSKPARTPRILSVCPFCNKKGHKTNRSKKCLFYNKPTTPSTAAKREDPVARHAEDTKEQDNENLEAAFQMDDRMAALQLADDDDFAEFVDADTWSTDDEEEGLETTTL
jgi:hypothetical protein